MNRQQRRARRRPNYFLRTGVDMGMKAAEDWPQYAALFNFDSLSKHNKKLGADINFKTGKSIDHAAINNEVFSTMGASLRGEYSHNDYPQLDAIRSKALLNMLGIKSNDSQLKAYWRMIFTILKDIIQSVRQAKRTGTLKETPIWATVNYIHSRHIARKYQHDKGRTNKLANTGGVIKQGYESTDDYGQRSIEAISFDDTNAVEYQVMLQRTLEIYQQFAPQQRVAVDTMVLCTSQDISWNKAFRMNESQFRKVGITTPKGAKKCYDSLDVKYPEWKNIRDSLKQ